MAPVTKPTNPKDAIGSTKTPFSTLSMRVIAEVGVAMLEGACKYGRHNYREAGVRASVYFDAVTARHLSAWWEGEDIDPDSGLSHVTKAIAGLMVLRDSMLAGNWIDDRPPKAEPGWLVALNELAAAIVAKYPNPKPPFCAVPFGGPRTIKASALGQEHIGVSFKWRDKIGRYTGRDRFGAAQLATPAPSGVAGVEAHDVWLLGSNEMLEFVE